MITKSKVMLKAYSAKELKRLKSAPKPMFGGWSEWKSAYVRAWNAQRMQHCRDVALLADLHDQPISAYRDVLPSKTHVKFAKRALRVLQRKHAKAA